MLSNPAAPRTSPSEASSSSPTSATYETPPSSPEVQLVKRVPLGGTAHSVRRGLSVFVSRDTLGPVVAPSCAPPTRGEHTPMPQRPNSLHGGGVGSVVADASSPRVAAPPAPPQAARGFSRRAPHLGTAPALHAEGSVAPWVPTPGKHKPVPDAVLVDHGLAPGLAVLVGAHASYAFFRAHTGGAYGKVHYAVRLDGTGAPLVVKAVRQKPKAGKARLTGVHKTFEAPLEQVNEEFRVHQALRRKVAKFGPRLHEVLLWRGEASLRTFVAFDRPSEVLELVADVHRSDKAGAPSPKAYLVSTCELGDVEGVYRALWRRNDVAEARDAAAGAGDAVAGARDAAVEARDGRRLVARSVAYQTFVELHVLHKAVKHVHFDVKLGNLHVNEAGAVRLADCGFALPSDEAGRVDCRGPRGSIVGPEMFSPSEFGRLQDLPPRLQAGADVWATWMASLQLLVPPSVQLPFYVVRASAERGPEERHDLCLAELRAFVQGAECFVPRVDGLPKLRRLPGGAGVWPKTGNAVVDAFFGAAAAADPRLVELALQHGLLFSVGQRGSGAVQAQAVGELLRWTPRQASAWWKALLVGLADEPRRRAIYGQLRRFASLTSHTPALAPYLRPAVSLAQQDAAVTHAPGAPACPKVSIGPAVVGGASLLGVAVGAGASTLDLRALEPPRQAA